MLFKVFLSFLLVAGSSTYNFGTPQRYPIFDSSSPTSYARDTSKDFTQRFEKTVKELIKNSEWIYNHTISVINSGFEEGFDSVTSWVVDLVLRMEFFMMADGSHFIFPLNENAETEQGYKAVAITGSKLLMSLNTMERADEIMKNVTRYFVSSNFAVSSNEEEVQLSENSGVLTNRKVEKMLKTYIREYFGFVSRLMETDKVLGEEYKKLLNEARETVKRDPTMHGPFEKIWEKHSETKFFKIEEIKRFLQDKKTFRQAIVNKLFLKQSVKHFSMIYNSTEYQRYLFTRALIQKAATNTNRNSKINDLYHQALAKSGEVVLEKSYEKVGDILFESLNKTLEANHDLNKEVKDLKTQIARSTKYDFDMFHVDFHLL